MHTHLANYNEFASIYIGAATAAMGKCFLNKVRIKFGLAAASQNVENKARIIYDQVDR